MKKPIFELDRSAMASANVVLFISAIRNNPELVGMLRDIQQPTDKYKAIVKFASLLGIPEERFSDFLDQQQNLTNEDISRAITKIVKEELKRLK